MSEHLYPPESRSPERVSTDDWCWKHIEDINEALVGGDPTLAGFDRADAIRRLIAERDRYRKALETAATAFNHALYRLRTPDMGGTYLDRARDILRLGETDSRAVLNQEKP